MKPYIKNNPEKILKMNDEFKFQNYEIDFIKLKNIIISKIDYEDFNNKNDLDKIIQLRIWVNNFLNKNGWNSENVFLHQKYYLQEIHDLDEILKHSISGKDGLCSFYARFFMYSCYSFGFNCRTLMWWHPGSHILNEVYLPQISKWVVMDPLYNCMFVDNYNKPLNSIELNDIKHENTLYNVKIERNNCTTYPNPLFRTFNLFSYCWDINYFSINSPSNFKIYKYKNKKYWPYRNCTDIVKSTFDKNIINFDCSLIKINFFYDDQKKKLDIKIIDYFVIDFKKYIFEVLQNNKVVNRYEFKSNNFTYLINDFNNIHKIYAENNRYGRSNEIEINFK